jgi:hypothetical protein
MSAAVQFNSLPFPVEEPPARNVFQGYVLSIIGTLMIFAGLCGAGMVAQAAIGCVVGLWLLYSNQPSPIPAAWVLVGCALGIPIGTLLSIFGISEGIRQRERGRRLRATDGRKVLNRTKQRPVLLLRSFTDEELPDPRL